MSRASHILAAFLGCATVYVMRPEHLAYVVGGFLMFLLGMRSEYEAAKPQQRVGGWHYDEMVTVEDN